MNEPQTRLMTPTMGYDIPYQLIPKILKRSIDTFRMNTSTLFILILGETTFDEDEQVDKWDYHDQNQSINNNSILDFIEFSAHTNTVEQINTINKLKKKYINVHYQWVTETKQLLRTIIRKNPFIRCTEQDFMNIQHILENIPLSNLYDFIEILVSDQLRKIPYWEFPNGMITFERNDRLIVTKFFLIPREELNMFENEESSSDEEDYLLENVKVTIPPREYRNYVTRIKIVKENRSQIPKCCAICLGEFKQTAEKTGCNHYYHARCLRKQLCCYGPPKCPICRTDVRDMKIIS